MSVVQPIGKQPYKYLIAFFRHIFLEYIIFMKHYRHIARITVHMIRTFRRNNIFIIENNQKLS
jgi:hypothetical protein